MGCVIRVYLADVTVAIREQLMGISSLLREPPGSNTYVIDFTHCFNKAILYSANTVVDHISEEVLNR
jgi:hypothetical protein